MTISRPKAGEDGNYVGSFFGYNFNINADSDEEFVDWLIAWIKKENPFLTMVLNRLLNESSEFTTLKKAL